MLNELNNIEEVKSITNQHEVVVLDLYATWCVPCQQMLPVIEELSNEISTVPFYKVDIDKVPEVKEFTGAKAVPMLLVYKNGRKKEFAFGVNPKDKIKGKIERTTK
jgi:thioredoxin 1